MSNWKYRLCFLLWLGVWCTGQLAGQSSLHFQAAPSENRISENASRCMLKDSDGFIWVGTIDGLNRYDGYRFRTYQNDPRDTSSISGNYITCLFEDSEGRLWVGTDKGLNLYEPDIDGFTQLEDRVHGSESLMTNYTTALTEYEGKLCVATYGSFGTFDFEEMTASRVSVDSLARDSMILHQDVTALSPADDSGFWIGYQSGKLSKYEDGKFIHFPSVNLGGSIFDLYEDAQSRVWIGSGTGLYRYDPHQDTMGRFHTERAWDIFPMNDEVWININFAGIYAWNEKREQFYSIPVFAQETELKGDVKAFLKDDQGIIWGAYHGLFKQDPFENRFRVVRHEKGNINSLSEPFVKGVAEDSNGNWVALTISKGLNYYDRSKQVWYNHLNHPWFDNALLEVRATQLLVIDKMAYVLTSGLLFEFNLENGQLKEFPSAKITGDYNIQLLQLDQDQLLISGDQLLLFDRRSSTFEDISLQKTAASKVALICRDQEGQTWASQGNKFYRFDPTQRSFVMEYEFPEGEIESTRSEISLARDHRGRFWIGRRNGLERFDPSTGTIRHYSIADGLPSNSIVSILVDHHDHLWLGTNHGLSNFDPEREVFRNFDRHDGIQDEIFLGNVALKNEEGLMLFGGVNGFNIFHPDSVSMYNPNPPKILISDFKIFNQSIQPGEEEVLSRHINDTELLELSYKHSTISFELLALGFSQPEKNQYAYMIEGVDPDWIYAGTGYTASYTGLPRGKELVFKAKAANHDGFWSEAKVLKLYITPPFWETQLFRFALVGLIVGLSLLYYRWRTRTIKLQNIRLEKEVMRQTAEIKEQAANLQQANTELKEQAELIRKKVLELDRLNKSQSRFFNNLSHEFRTPLTLLFGYMEELAEAEYPDKILAKVMAGMRISSGQLLELVNQLMDTAKLESGQYKLRVVKGNIREEINSIFHSFRVLADRKGLDFRLAIAEEVAQDSWFDRDVLQKVLNNLLSNALKFTNEGYVELEVSSTKDQVLGQCLALQLKDTGIGIAPEHLTHIFDRFYQAERELSAHKQGTGIGLSLVRQLVHLHKGSIEVRSKSGEGSTFWVKLPTAGTAFVDSEKVVVVQQLAPNVDRWSFARQDTSVANPGSETGSLPKKGAPLILVVEDDPGIRSLICRQLSAEYHVLQAEDGKQGWSKAVAEIPDLIVSDVIMPKMNGFQLCHAIKNDPRTSHIPTILLTALSEKEKKLEGLSQGADAYVAKPFSREELSLTIFNLLAHREKLRRCFLKEYSLEHFSEAFSPMDQQFLEKINDTIAEKLSDSRLGVDYLTRAVGISRTQLFRKLKSLTGMSASEYIRDYRLRKAYHLLHEEDLTISEVIHTTGFNSRSYFYDSFKRKFGMVPSQLRKI